MQKRISENISGLKKEWQEHPALEKQLLLLRFTGLCLILLLQVFLAQWMGAKNYGNYVVIFCILNFLVTLSMLGFDTASFRFISLYNAEKDWSAMKGFFVFSRSIVLIFSQACALALLFFLLYKTNRFSINFSEALLWAVFTMPVIAFIHFGCALLRGLHKPKSALLPFYFLLPVSGIVTCFVYYLLHGQQLRVDAAALIFLCCSIGTAVFTFLRVKGVLQPKLLDAQPRYEMKGWTNAALKVFVFSISSLVLKRSDILFISGYLGNTHAGIYTSAVLISSVISFIFFAVSTLFLPRIRSLFESDKRECLNEMRRSMRIVLTLAVPVTFILVISGRFILGVFGTAFIAAYVPLIILCISQFIYVSTGMGGALVSATGSRKMFFTFQLVAALVNVALNSLLIPALGLNGAALASLISTAMLNFILYYFADYQLKSR